MSDGHESDTSISLYGRLWPKITYTSPSEGDQSTDITDALSRLGVSAKYKLTDTLSAIALAEVRINLGHDGSEDFFTEHLGYVGLESSNMGLFAIGTQWNPYYNIVAAVTDVYYHRASPFGYDNVGPFREEQIVRYALSFSGVSLDLGTQLKGQAEGDEDYDKVYAGLGYSYGPVYVGVAYLGDSSGMEQRDYVGLGASLSLMDDLYVAVTYQSLDYEMSPNRESLDVAATYSFGSGYTLIAGLFTYDADVDTSDLHHIGHNLTLVKALTGNVKVFTEWLRKDFDESDNSGQTVDQLSLGIRIDFNAQVI
ncbi:MAG: porin [Candidatus Tectomicrobia bacterium]|nr:porin [Candidatus Tectomicrobia bacterium]